MKPDHWQRIEHHRGAEGEVVGGAINARAVKAAATPISTPSCAKTRPRWNCSIIGESMQTQKGVSLQNSAQP
jgi:hypothetical protein